MKQIKLTERQIILKCLEQNTDITCRKSNCDEPEKEGNTGECCDKCALEILNIYENKICNNILTKFAKWIFRYIGKYHFKSENDMIERFKQETNVKNINDTYDKLSELSRLYEQSFNWGCNDKIKALYANAVYSIISQNKTFENCEQEFLDYIHDNHIF